MSEWIAGSGKAELCVGRIFGAGLWFVMAWQGVALAQPLPVINPGRPSGPPRVAAQPELDAPAPKPLPAATPAPVPQPQPTPTPTPTPQPTPVPQPTPPTEPVRAEELTAEKIDARIKQVEELTDLAAEIKTAIVEVYKQAQAELVTTADWRKNAQRWQGEAASLPADLAKVRTDLETLPAEPNRESIEALDLATLEERVQARERELSDPETGLKKQLANWEAESGRRTTRRSELPGLIAAAETRLAEVKKQAEAPPAADEIAPRTQARRGLLNVQRQRLEQELAALRAELAYYEAADSGTLVRQRRDYFSRLVTLRQKELDVSREILNQYRQIEAERRLRQARRELQQTDPQLQPMAKFNAELADREKQIVGQIQATTSRLATIVKKAEDLRERYAQTKKRVDQIGLTESIGLLLRREKTKLMRSAMTGSSAVLLGNGAPAAPTVPGSSSEIPELNDADIGEIRLNYFQLEEEWTRLADLSKEVESHLAELPASRAAVDVDALRAAATELLQRRRELLDTLIKSYDTYLTEQTKLEAARKDLAGVTSEYRNYIDERVLWIRNGSMISGKTISDAAAAAAWLGSSVNWQEAYAALKDDVHIHFEHAIFVGLLFVLWLFYRPRMRRKLVVCGDKASRSTCRDFLPTGEAMLLTLVEAMWLPLMIGYIGWRLRENVLQNDQELAIESFSWAIGSGLLVASVIFVPWLVFRRICARKGLAEAHFGWPPLTLRTLRRQLRWLLPVIFPAILLTSVLSYSDNEQFQDSLGRLAFMISMGSLALVGARLFHPHGAVLQEVVTFSQSITLKRAATLLFYLTIGLPLLLVGLAVVGYYFTAVEIAARLMRTVWLMMALLVLRGLLMRWLLLRRRRLAIEKARERRLAAEAEQQGLSDTQGSSNVPIPSEPETDFAAMSEQSRNLMKLLSATLGIVGLWLIWVDVFPAINVLDSESFEILNYTTEVTTETKTPDGEIVFSTGTKVETLTYGDVIFAIAVIAIAFVAAQNIPGLLEITVLQRLSMNSGSRYAVTTLARYVLVTIGLVFAAGLLGLGWNKVQWLIAAISVGLGFGLQEIFANFVSGLILLFERPIRVGDIVTIGDVSGVVTKIRMRATTITNWDRKELVVPNKDFITGRLLNWTLSDQINRLEIVVGVAYGSDIELTRQTLLRVCDEHPNVLRDPGPITTFDGFGDNALNFTVRAYLPNFENRLMTIHELHGAIDREFRKEAIEISFPQRDLHIRSWPSELREVVTSRRESGPGHNGNTNGNTQPNAAESVGTEPVVADPQDDRERSV